MKKLSLRSRLIVFFTFISCLIWSGAGVLAWLEAKEQIDEFFDTYQMAMARHLAGTDWSQISSKTQFKTNKIMRRIQGADDEDEALGFAVFDAEGRKIFHDGENGRNFVYQDISGSFVTQRVDGENWRLIWVKSADEKFRIAVGQELEYREDMAWDMLEEFTAPWIAGLVILLLAIIFIIGTEFKSLKSLAAAITARDNDDLSPISDKDLPSEVLPLTAAMNNLLEKVNSLLQRERRFISDAAHELRTPLAAMKIQLDVVKLSADDEDTREAALEKLEQGVERASRLVEQLLALSRLESMLHSGQIISEKLNCKQIVKQLCGEYERDIAGKNISLTISGNGQGAFACGNPVWAELMMRNLLDNAIKYSPEKAEITVCIGENYVKVCNTGVKIKPQDLSKLGQRFFRIAGQNEKGNGIGLSIVKCIADFYGCDLIFTNHEGVFAAEIRKN